VTARKKKERPRISRGYEGLYKSDKNAAPALVD
jgi:hypothetical protein